MFCLWHNQIRKNTRLGFLKGKVKEMTFKEAVKELVQVLLTWARGQGDLLGLLLAWLEMVKGVYPAS